MAKGLPDAARRLVERAADIAFNMGSSAVEPAHLLFALASGGDNMVARVFEWHGLKFTEHIPEHTEDQHGLRKTCALSPDALAVIDAARQTAIRRGEIPVHVSHIALALMRSRDRWLQEVLQRNSVDAAAVIRELLRELGGFNIAAELFGGDFNIAVWSEESQRIVRAAPYEASIFGHDYIGSEHILLALLRDAINAAAQFLEAFYEIPITVVGASSAVEAVLGSGASLPRRIETTSNANRVITDSQLAASRMGRSFVGAEHILIAVIANPHCTAARALAKRVNLCRLEKDLVKTFTAQE